MIKKLMLIVATALIALCMQSAVLALDSTGEPEETEKETTEAAEVQSRNVFLEENGKTVHYKTQASTVGEFLEEAAIKIYEHDVVTPGLGSEIKNNMEINISRGFQITLIIYDRAYYRTKVETVRPGRRVDEMVREYSKETGFEYAYDISLWVTEVTPGMTVKLYLVQESITATNEEIPFETEYYYTDMLPEGYEVMLAEGLSGTVFVTQRIRYEGPEETVHEDISSEVTFEPVNMVIAVGTGPADMPTPDATVLNAINAERTGIITPEEELRQEYINMYAELYNSGWVGVIMPDEGDETFAAPQQEISEYITFAQPGLVPLSQFSIQDNVLCVNGQYVEYKTVMDMSATAYSSDYASTGKRPGDKYFGITASGMKAQIGVVAVDPTVIPMFTKMFIEGYGFAIAGDTGKSIKGNIVDLYFNTANEVKQFGRQKLKVYILTDQEFEIAIKQ